MIKKVWGLLGKTGLVLFLRGSNKAGLKRFYSCCTYVNNQPKFIASQLVLLWLSLRKRKGDNYREEYCLHLCLNLILILLTVFKGLLYTSQQDWILNSSSFFKYLVQISKLMFLIFFSPFHLGLLRTLLLDSLRIKVHYGGDNKIWAVYFANICGHLCNYKM